MLISIELLYGKVIIDLLTENNSPGSCSKLEYLVSLRLKLFLIFLANKLSLIIHLLGMYGLTSVPTEWPTVCNSDAILLNILWPAWDLLASAKITTPSTVLL